MTFCVLDTADAVTLKLAEVDPEETVTAVGTCKALLLLLNETDVGLVAAALRDTEHEVVVGPVRLCVAHVTPAREGVLAVVG